MSAMIKRHSVAFGHLPSANWRNRIDLQVSHAKVVRKIFSTHPKMRRHIPHVKTLDPPDHYNPRRSTLGSCAEPCIPLLIPPNLGRHRCLSGCLANRWLFGAIVPEPPTQRAIFVSTEVLHLVAVA